MSEDEVDELAKKLEQDLLKMYGSPVLKGAELQKALGYDICVETGSSKKNITYHHIYSA